MATATTVDKQLFVIWREPRPSDTRHVVGKLWREGGDYCFAYIRSPDDDSVFARYDPLPEFPDHHRGPANAYRSRYLFPTFAHRIPSPSRPDYQELLDAWGLTDVDDQLEILSRTGGLQKTDRLELSEYRADDDPLIEPLLIRLAGAKYHHGIKSLADGQLLRLERDSDNAFDPNAVKVLDSRGEQVGWVPRTYSALIAGHLDRGTPIGIEVDRHLMLPAEYDRVLVRLFREDA